MFPYSLVHTSFETIDDLLREAINGHSLLDRTWCTMVCPAVRSAFGFQGRNFVHEDRKVLVPDVIMLIVVVDIIIIEHGLRPPAFDNIGRSRYFVGVKVRHHCLFR